MPELSPEELLATSKQALEFEPNDLEAMDNKKKQNKAVTKAYHKLSLKHHPDKGGDTEDFKKINNAYQELLKYVEDPEGYLVSNPSDDEEARTEYEDTEHEDSEYEDT